MDFGVLKEEGKTMTEQTARLFVSTVSMIWIILSRNWRS